MTLRASMGQGSMAVREAECRALRDMYGMCLRGGSFLLPPDFAGCTHEYEQWVTVGSGFCVCGDCGKMHMCREGACPETATRSGERICLISGCVTMENEMKEERDAMERLGPAGGGGWEKKTDGGGRITTTELWEMVERVVVELLQSDKNGVCARQEKEKCEVKEHALFCRIVRELAQNKKTNRWRPNVLCIVAQVVYGCRRQREEVGKNVSVGEVVKKCTESITGLIVQHGWVRVWRQIQNYARGREFIASMLYLMRMGITFQKRQILPKMTVLNALLPIQALLPSVFKIRAKSITEGENIIKLDIRKIPL